MKKILIISILTLFIVTSVNAYDYNKPADNVHMYPAGVSTQFKSYTNKNQVRRTYGDTTVTTTSVPTPTIDYSQYKPANYHSEKVYSNRTLWYDAEGNRVGSVVQYSDGRTVIYDANGNVKNVLYESN